MLIRPERPVDAQAITEVTALAFAAAPHASGTEARIVEDLRAAGALSLSLVATEGGTVIGHAAFSPVTISGDDVAWLGLGPLSVRPDRQGQGVGSALVRHGLDRAKAAGAKGCVLLGDPAYYARFGFANDPALVYPGAPPEYFLALSFAADRPRGEVAYHSAFDAA